MIGYKKAMWKMQLGSRLMRHHIPGGMAWYVIPGGEVSEQVSEKIRNNPSVVGGKDSMFPGVDQTYRLLTFVEKA